MLAELLTMEALTALVMLTSLEIVLGVDNVLFITILSERLPEHQRRRARNLGLILAMVQRIGLLFLITWIMKLEQYVLFTLPWDMTPEVAHGTSEVAEGVVEATAEGGSGTAITIKSLILIVGGLFLLYKATSEIHGKLEDDPEAHQRARAGQTFGKVITQIVLLDLVFSIDSVLTAVGLTKQIAVMVIAVVVSCAVMIAMAGKIAGFVAKHPTIKMLALSILFMIGALLVAEGLGAHIPHGYLYFAMAFALVVEMLNIKSQARRKAKRAGGE